MKLLRRFSFPLVSLCLAYLFLVLAASAVPQTVQADAVSGGDKQQGIASLAERWLWYRGIAACYSAHDVGKNDIDKINAGTWFETSFGGDTRTAVGYLDGSDDGKISCGDGAQITKGLSSIGFADNIAAFCSMSVASRASGSCATGSGEFDMSGSKDDQFNAFLAAVQNKIPDHAFFPYGTSNEKTKPILYWVGLRSLKAFCGGKDLGKLDPSQGGNVGDSKRQVVVNVVDLGTGKIERHVYGLSRDASDLVNDVWAEKGGGGGGLANQTVNSKDLTCQQLAQLTWSYDDAFSTFVQAYNRADPEDAAKEGKLAGDDGEGGDSTTSCAIDGVGWIVCPVIGFLTKLNDTAYDFIDGLLTIPKGMFTSENQGTMTAWEAFRNMANVAFVVAFMIIIYSQLTGAGISNYGIKKLLPKLIITAILVNVSFYLCAIAVDISNIVGSSIKSFLESIPVGTSNVNPADGLWEKASGPLLTGIVGIGILLLIILAPASLLAFALIIFILIARQAFIILLVVMSPLAFVAYLLPNTEDWFKRWWKALSAMLMVFPIIGAVFGISKLASDILLEVAQNSVGDDGDATLKIVAASVLAVPLFAIPSLLKAAMSGAGTIGARLSGLQDKANGRMAQSIKGGRIGEAKRAFDRRSDLRKINRRRGDSFLAQQAKARFGEDSLAHRAMTLQSRFDRSSAGRYLGGDRGAATAVAQYDKAFQEDVSAASVLQKDMAYDKRLEMATKGSLDGKKIGEAQRVAAINHIMDNGNFKDRTELIKSVGSMGKRELIAASDGYYKSGMQGVFGAKFGGDIADGDVRGDLSAVANMLQTEALGNIDAGKLKAETIGTDADIAEYISSALTSGPVSPSIVSKAKTASATALAAQSLQGQRSGLVEKHLNDINSL